MRKMIVTNALPYANGDLHLGHMLGYIQSDIWVRFQKLCGNECHFICGSDTHGTPIMLKAKEKNITPIELIKKTSQGHQNDFIDFQINFDNYHSTHNLLNQNMVQNIFSILYKKKLIAKKYIAQYFDRKAKMFLPDRFIKGICPKCKAKNQYGDGCECCSSTYDSTDIINPKSVITGEEPIKKNSLHFFFKLSKLKKSIYEWVENHKLLQPEIKNKLKEWFNHDFIKDWDISRDHPYFGFTIPNTTNKYFYVWLDAPIGYLASFKDLCEKKKINFEEFWNEQSKTELYHFIGKDIIYFHALFWPSILQEINYRKPTGIFTHGFLTINGKKMSKSRGRFIKARTYLNYLHSDFLRYYFASKYNSNINDINFNLKEFCQKINTDLIGKVINIASRCSPFINKIFNNMLSSRIHDEALVQRFYHYHTEITQNFEKRNFAQSLRIILHLASIANKYIDDYKPWNLKKLGKNDLLHDVCSMAINFFKIIIGYLKPIIPAFSLKCEEFLNINKTKWLLKLDIKEWLINHKINNFKPIMSRINFDDIKDMMKVT